MTTYTGSIDISGTLKFAGSGLGSGTFSGTLADTLSATIDSSGNGPGMDSANGNIDLTYSILGGAPQNVVIPVNVASASFEFQSGTYSLTENVPVAQFGTVPITFSGTATANQSQISGDAAGTLSGNFDGFPFTGTISGTGVLNAAIAISPVVTNDFETILQRAPTSSEGALYTSDLSSGALTPSGVIETLIATTEAQTGVFPVVDLYQAIYGRVPDAAGLQYWTGVYESLLSSVPETPGSTVNEAMVALATPFVNPTLTSEFVTRYGANPSASTYITELYGNVLGRQPDAAGQAYWTNVLNGLAQTETPLQARAALLEQFVDSTEYRTATLNYTHGFLAASAGGTETYSGSLFSQTPDSSGAPSAVALVGHAASAAAHLAAAHLLV